MNLTLHNKKNSFFILGCVVLSTFLTSCRQNTAYSDDTWDSTSAGPDSLSFIVIGDWGKNYKELQMSVAEQMNVYSKKHQAQFVITTGDNFYENGVASINDLQWKTSFEDIYNKDGLQVTWYPVLGNHDYRTNPQAQVQYSSISNRWKMPGRYYTFTKDVGGSKSALFVFTDTSPFITEYYDDGMSDLPKQDTAAQLAWLRSTLAKSDEQWKIVIGHHPVYAVGKHGNTPELIQRFKPVFLQTHTDFYICGHDHSLQYITVPNDPVQYLVSGGGAEATPVSSNPYSPFARATPGFLVMTIYPRRVHFYFYNYRGELLYRRQVKK